MFTPNGIYRIIDYARCGLLEYAPEILMKRPSRLLIPILFALSILAAACQSSGGSPPQTVQSYLQARVQSDVDKMISLSCATWESQARVEAASFKSMKAQLDSVSCKEAGADGNVTLVACTGKIVTSYNGESRDWSVSDKLFKVVQDRGDWRMCGYK
jgi:hypothetical protein